MKSQIFTTAWKIFRSETITFSNALKKAWEFSKKVTFRLNVAFNKVEVPTFTYNENGFLVAAGNLFDTYLNASKYAQTSNDGATHDYGINAYNGD